MILDAATLEVTTLDTPPVFSGASWSRDGSRIAFSVWSTGTSGRGTFATVNSDGSELNVFYAALGKYSVDGIAWSPDGTKFALTLRDESSCPWYCDTGFGIMNVDGSSLQVFDNAHTCFGGAGSSCWSTEAYIWGAPAWSPDGARVAYTVSRGSECWDERVQCGTDIRAVAISDNRVEVLLSDAGLPAWR